MSSPEWFEEIRDGLLGALPQRSPVLFRKVPSNVLTLWKRDPLGRGWTNQCSRIRVANNFDYCSQVGPKLKIRDDGFAAARTGEQVTSTG